MAESAYTTQDEALQAVRPGWHIVGSRDDYEDAPFTTPDGKPPLPSDPKTVKKLIGRVLVIQGPNGEPDEMTVGPSDKSVTWDTSIDPATNQPKPLQPGLVIIKGPGKGPAAAGSKPATPAAGLERLDGNLQPVQPGQAAVYVRDPNAPAGTQPFKLDDTLGDPTTWTPIYEDPVNKTGRVIGLFDPKAGKVAASIAAPAGSKPSDPSKWQAVYRTPGDPKSGIVGQWDPTNSELHAVAQQADGKQVAITDTAIYVIDKDTGKATLSTTIDKTSPVQVVSYPDGSIYTYDPNEKDKSKSLTRLQGTQPPATIKQQTPGGEVTLIYDEASKSYKMPPGTQAPATVDAPGSTALEYIVYRDANGNELFKAKNPNYRPTQTTQGAQSTTARQIQQWNQKTGQWEWVENKGRIVASDALRAMAVKLTGQVIAGDISEDEATKLITAANAQMANDIAQQNVDATKAATARGAAGDILQANTQRAQTAAGLLNQRVSAGQGMLSSALSFAGSGPLVGLQPGAGAALLNDIKGFTADLGGGQAVYDTAARLVQATSRGDAPQDAQAYGVMAQMLDKWQKDNNTLHPAVQATLAAQQSVAANGLAAPAATAPGPAAPAAAQPLQPVATQPIVNRGGVGPWAGGATPAPGTTFYAPGYNPATGGFTAPGVPPPPPALTAQAVLAGRA